MLSRVVSLIFGLSIFFCSLLGAQDTPFWATVIADGVNVRADSTISSQVVTQLSKDEKVYIVGGAYEWFRIQLPPSTEVYVYRKYIEVKGSRAKSLADNLNVRSGPGLSYPVLGQVSRGNVFRFKRFSGDWVCVLAGDSRLYGWVHKRFLRPLGYSKKTIATGSASDKKAASLARNTTASKSGLEEGGQGNVSLDMRREEGFIREAYKDKDGDSASETKKGDSDLPIAKGVVEEMGRVIGLDYDYKLVDEDGKVQYYLSADSYMIAPFSGRKSAVYGEVVKVEGNVPVLKVDKIEKLR